MEPQLGTDCQLPMRGDGRIFVRAALLDRFWFISGIAFYLLVLFAMLIVLDQEWWLRVCAGWVICAFPYTFAVRSVQGLIHAIRCATCGSDGLWILLQTHEGRLTLFRAHRLYFVRLLYEPGRRSRDENPPDWLREEEHELWGRQQRLIDDWVQSGKPYGPATRAT